MSAAVLSFLLGRNQCVKVIFLNIELFFFFSNQDDASVLKFEVRATAWPEKNAKVIELHKDKQAAYVRILLWICEEHVKVEKLTAINIVEFYIYLYSSNEYSVHYFEN